MTKTIFYISEDGAIRTAILLENVEPAEAVQSFVKFDLNGATSFTWLGDDDSPVEVTVAATDYDSFVRDHPDVDIERC